MNIEQRVYLIDRVWWSPESNRIVGDMSFSFNEANETLCNSRKEALENAKDYVNYLEDEETSFGMSADDEFPILEVHEQLRRANVDSPEEFDARIADIADDKIICVVPMCTRQVAISIRLASKYNGARVYFVDNPNVEE